MCDIVEASSNVAGMMMGCLFDMREPSEVVR